MNRLIKFVLWPKKVSEHDIVRYYFKDYLNLSVNPINLALEVTKQCYSRCICCKFSIWLNFDSENAIILLYFFKYFCSKNRTFHSFLHLSTIR